MVQFGINSCLLFYITQNRERILANLKRDYVSKRKYKPKAEIIKTDNGVDDDDDSQKRRPKMALITDPKKPQGVVNVSQGGEKVQLLDCINNNRVTDDDSSSKIDHDADGDLSTMPEDTYLTGRHVTLGEVFEAESFFGLALSDDGESVEVRQLMHREDITVAGLSSLIHTAMAVTDNSVKEFLCNRGSPVNFIPITQVPIMRNIFSKQLIGDGLKEPEEPGSDCVSVATRETHFISEDMERVPNTQLLVNRNLVPRDTGAVAVLVQHRREKALLPVFTVNMNDWMTNAK